MKKQLFFKSKKLIIGGAMFNFTKSRLSGRALLFISTFILLSTFLSATIINIPADQPTIQAGIIAAVDSDTVLVQPGTYVENINFNGKLITVGSLFLTTQDTTYVSSTIIDGNSSGSVVTFATSESSSAVLCGFTITNGLASGSGWPDDSGGGIFCHNSSPSLQNLTISGNTASNYGGGIYCMYSNPSIVNVTISDNYSSGNYDSNGGGLYCDYSNPSLQNVTISGNFADTFGGGIFCYQSNPDLENVTISNNSASWGGGIFCWGHASPSLQNVAITGNSASDEGGGILIEEQSNPSLENVTISSNTANEGGGIWCRSNSNPTLINSILWNDSPEEIYFSDTYAPNSITISYSDIQGGEAGIVTNNNGTVNWLDGNIDSDPLFVDPAIGDYHLTENSPCIDAGDPASPLDPDGTIADMGAYYFDQLTPPEADFEADVTSGEAPLEVQFTDLSTLDVIEWMWDFDNDGTIDSNEQNPIYIYDEVGIYTVSLTVTNGYSEDTEIKEDYIEVTGTGTEHGIISVETMLYQNHPNPFNPVTNIRFDIKENETGILSIYNIKGQFIESHQFEAGHRNFQWNAANQASGVYLYKLQTESSTVNKKMLLLK